MFQILLKEFRYHKKINHNVSYFLGLKTARNVKSCIHLATTKILFGSSFLGNYLVAIIMDTNGPLLLDERHFGGQAFISSSNAGTIFLKVYNVKVVFQLRKHKK